MKKILASLTVCVVTLTLLCGAALCEEGTSLTYAEIVAANRMSALLVEHESMTYTQEPHLEGVDRIVTYVTREGIGRDYGEDQSVRTKDLYYTLKDGELALVVDFLGPFDYEEHCEYQMAAVTQYEEEVVSCAEDGDALRVTTEIPARHSAAMLTYYRCEDALELQPGDVFRNDYTLDKDTYVARSLAFYLYRENGERVDVFSIDSVIFDAPVPAYYTAALEHKAKLDAMDAEQKHTLTAIVNPGEENEFTAVSENVKGEGWTLRGVGELGMFMDYECKRAFTSDDYQSDEDLTLYVKRIEE